MLNSFAFRPLALAAALGLSAFALPANAAPLSAASQALVSGTTFENANLVEVGHRGRYKKRHYRKSRRHNRGNAAGAAAAAGIIGLTVGAIIASQPRAYARPRVYYERSAPPRTRYYGRPEPYTAEWYRYCDAKYRSFDPQSGTFMSYSGVRKLCR